MKLLPSARTRRETHCKHGHELNEKNLYLRKDGQRICRQCQRLGQIKFRESMSKSSAVASSMRSGVST